MMEQIYAMKEWQNVDEIYAKLNHLLEQPARRLKCDALNKYQQHFESNCAKSKEMVTKAKMFIPGGVQHNLALNHPFPIAVR